MVKYVKGLDDVERSIREFVLDTGLITEHNLVSNVSIRSKAYRTKYLEQSKCIKPYKQNT